MTDPRLEAVAKAICCPRGCNEPRLCFIEKGSDALAVQYDIRARAALAVVDREQWRPISEAPKDGTRFVAGNFMNGNYIWLDFYGPHGLNNEPAQKYPATCFVPLPQDKPTGCSAPNCDGYPPLCRCNPPSPQHAQEGETNG